MSEAIFWLQSFQNHESDALKNYRQSQLFARISNVLYFHLSNEWEKLLT